MDKPKVYTFYAPTESALTENHYGRKTVFLAGSIEMGAARDWQDELIMFLEDALPEDTHVTIFNPRRKDWDSSWVQSKDNPQFRQQVEWELECLGKADLIVMHFVPGTMSPISLLELGLHSDKSIIVYCPEGFARKGNVDIVCEKLNIPVFEDESAFQIAVLKTLGDKYCMPIRGRV